MAVALTCKIGASGSPWLGGTMVTVFYICVCVLCVVVERQLVLGVQAPCNVHVRHKYFYCAIFFSKYPHARMVLDIVCSYVITWKKWQVHNFINSNMR